MGDDSQDDLRVLCRKLSEAYDRFYEEVYRESYQFQYWRFGPYGSFGMARIYRAILLAAFVAGVILSVVSQVTQGLGFALVVGSLFGFGAWIAQAWSLSIADRFRIRNELIREFQLPPEPPPQLSAAALVSEIDLNQPNARYYAAQIKDIANRIKEMARDGRLDSSG